MAKKKGYSPLYYKIFGIISLVFGIPIALMGLIVISAGGWILLVPSILLILLGIKWVRKSKQLRLSSSCNDSKTTTSESVHEPALKPQPKQTLLMEWELNGKPIDDSGDTEESEDDLPWGWFGKNEEFINKIDAEYSHFLHTWIESQNKSPRELYSALKSFVRYMECVQKLCKRKGKYFERWFDAFLTGDGYLEERQKELNELSDTWLDLQKKYEAKQEKLSHLDDDLWNLLALNESILQTDVYKNFDSDLKQDIQSKLYCWDKSGKIIRIKNGNTYLIKPVTVETVTMS